LDSNSKNIIFMAKIHIKGKKQEMAKIHYYQGWSMDYASSSLEKVTNTIMREFAILFIKNLFKQLLKKLLDEKMSFSLDNFRWSYPKDVLCPQHQNTMIIGLIGAFIVSIVNKEWIQY